jgi:hypothetical protein
MNQLRRMVVWLGRIVQLIVAATLLLLAISNPGYSTARPSSPSIGFVKRFPLLNPVPATPDQQVAAPGDVPNPVATALIRPVPSSDGTAIYVTASGVGSTSGNLVLNIDPGSGPTGHIGSYTMTISGTSHLATAIGFTPEQDIGIEGDDAMSVTTTISNTDVGTGPINFERAYIQPTAPEEISVDDGAFKVHMPNLGSVPDNTYLVVMSTNAPPTELPPGHTFASKSYDLSPSGALTQTDKLMSLDFRVPTAMPGGSDPHTLAIAMWDPIDEVWNVLGGNYSDTSGRVTLAVQQFGIYALVTTSTWRDSFRGAELSGVSSRVNTQRGFDDTIILSGGVLSGTVTSIPIVPTPGATHWGTLRFSTTRPVGTSITIDVLDGNGSIVQANATDSADLSDLAISTHPTLILRATLTSTQTGQTPRLQEWSLGWLQQEQDQLYLPMIRR